MNVNKKFLVATASLLAAFVLVFGIGSNTVQDKSRDVSKEEWESEVRGMQPEVATFAGGCFWCTEAVYENVKGVDSAVSGYIGGKESTATYKQVSSGKTDHREAVQVKYYPSIVSYDELLDKYWRSIDPTDAGGQFSDRGPQYTTAIYVHNEIQRKAALKSKKELENSEKFEEPIVTEVKNYTTFYRAEDYHQNYSRRNTVRYNAYKRASGRKTFLEDVWDKIPY